jgi:hypothetical protein
LEGQLDALSVWIIETGTGANPSHIRFFNSAAKEYMEIANDFGHGDLAIMFGTKGTIRGHSYFKPRGVKYVDANGVEKKPRAYYFECAMKRAPDGTPAWLSFIGNAMFNPTEERCTHNVGTVNGTFAGDSNWTPAAHANKQWRVKFVSLKDCCAGNDTPTSNKNICSAAFNGSSAWENPAVCDNYMIDYCGDSEHTDDPMCSCINSPITKYNPICADAKCLKDNGYITRAMMAFEKCPDVVDCSSQLALGSVGREVQIGAYSTKQQCGTGSSTATPPPSSGLGGGDGGLFGSGDGGGGGDGDGGDGNGVDNPPSSEAPTSNILMWALVGFVFVVVIAIAIMMSRRGNDQYQPRYDQYLQPQYQQPQYQPQYQQPQQPQYQQQPQPQQYPQQYQQY